MATVEQNLSDHPALSIRGAASLQVGIVVSEWNHEITDNLLAGAKAYFQKCGLADAHIAVYKVPGSFELPLGAKWLIEKKQVEGVVCLGSVIKGETDHFHYVCSAVSQGVKDVSLQTGRPVIFGVLTDNTKQQALDRSGGKHGNKGIEAAATLLKMLQLEQKLE